MSAVHSNVPVGRTDGRVTTLLIVYRCSLARCVGRKRLRSERCLLAASCQRHWSTVQLTWPT